MAELNPHDKILQELLERVRRIEAAVMIAPQRMPKSPGPRPIDDADAIQEVRDLIAKGVDRWAAINSVAAALGGNVKSHGQRLRRKLRGS